MKKHSKNLDEFEKLLKTGANFISKTLTNNSMKKFSQNFMDDQSANFVTRVIGKGKLVYEIGPGKGALTKHLLEKFDKVIAIEADERMLEILRTKFAKEIEEEKLELVYSDFLEYELPKKQLIIGAIPYHITTQILLKLLETGFEKAVLVVQKEYAERMTSEAGSREYSRLTVLVNTQCTPEIIGFIPKEKFSPQPLVDSAIISLEPLKKKIKLSEVFVRSLFNHKKQTVKNALRHSRHEFNLDKKQMEEKINKLPKEYLDKKVYELSIPEISECEKLFLK